MRLAPSLEQCWLDLATASGSISRGFLCLKLLPIVLNEIKLLSMTMRSPAFTHPQKTFLMTL